MESRTDLANVCSLCGRTVEALQQHCGHALCDTCYQGEPLPATASKLRVQELRFVFRQRTPGVGYNSYNHLLLEQSAVPEPQVTALRRARPDLLVDEWQSM